MGRGRKTALLLALASGAWLSLETLLPPDRQPTARAAIAAIDAYQAVISPALRDAGAACRYSTTCSHYAEDAIARHGFAGGSIRAAGRLARCTPWGGGADPSQQPQQPQETEEQRKQREEFEKSLKELGQEFEKARKELPKEAGEAFALCGIGCAGIILTTLIGFAVTIFMMVYAFKDAQARGDQNAVLWLVLIFFLHWIGFVVYMCVRPKGEMAPCGKCQQKMMVTLPKCPHCGNENGPGKPPLPPA